MRSVVQSTPSRRRLGQQSLVFSPRAWLKLQFFCHRGDTEIAGFGLSAKDDLLYVEDFVTVKQRVSPMTVAFDDDAVAEFVDRSVDAGLQPCQILRIWCHTHPGSSPDPSGTDEDTFARVFGMCDWAVMFILSRTNATYCRLSFHTGPGATSQLPVTVDWAAWPQLLRDPEFLAGKAFFNWDAEYTANIHPLCRVWLQPSVQSELAEKSGPWEPFTPGWDWTDLDQELMEDHERYARLFESDT